MDASGAALGNPGDYWRTGCGTAVHRMGASPQEAIPLVRWENQSAHHSATGQPLWVPSNQDNLWVFSYFASILGHSLLPKLVYSPEYELRLD